MGRMKFMFPNDMGIWLHDTPDKDLFGEADRHVQRRLRPGRGCAAAGALAVRKAARGANRRRPSSRSRSPSPVPVYITYLTAAPSDRGIAVPQRRL